MKKFALGVFCLLLAVGLCGCSLFYSMGKYEDDGLCYHSHKMRAFGDCFVSSYQWDGTEEGKTIVIPDRYQNLPVTSLGGYYGRGVPSPFCIRLPEEYDIEYYSGSLRANDNMTVRDIEFRLYIGKNVSEFSRNAAKNYNICREGEEQVCIRTTFYVECDEKNKTFYSSDGKLYSRADDTLVDEFFYVGDPVEYE